MTTLHGRVIDMTTVGNLGADWLVGMQAHFGQTGEYRMADVYRLLGDQRQSFDLAGGSVTVACHQAENEGDKA